MTAIIAIAVVTFSVVVVAFTVLVLGVRRTDRLLTLRDWTADGYADAFARRVLGVSIRQPGRTAGRKAEAACHGRVGR
jgi:hypothetical protein